MPVFKTLSDRCKFYEKNFGCGTFLMPQVPALCRIDGRSFHTFTKGLQRPFDMNLTNLMLLVAENLMQESGAKWYYTQSDEISLGWHFDRQESQMYFDGKIQKLNSNLASMASAVFNKYIHEYLPQKASQIVTFDARCWSVPNKEEASKYLLWRQMDAMKNSVSMAASTYFPHKTLQGLNTAQRKDLLAKAGFPWENLDPMVKYGFFRRPCDDNIISKPISNRIAVMFDQADPISITNGDEK